MPEYLKALIVILVLAAALFWLAAPHVSGRITASDDYRRRVGVWLAITVAAFLAHNYWIFVIVAGALLAFAAARGTAIRSPSTPSSCAPCRRSEAPFPASG